MTLNNLFEPLDREAMQPDTLDLQTPIASSSAPLLPGGSTLIPVFGSLDLRVHLVSSGVIHFTYLFFLLQNIIMSSCFWVNAIVSFNWPHVLFYPPTFSMRHDASTIY